jgi:hypothetical protein
MFPPPLRALVIGVIISNLVQWGFWRQKNMKAPWGGYLTAQFGVLLVNFGVDVAAGVLWSYGALDLIVDKMAVIVPGAKDWATSGVPYTPPIGLMLGFFADFFGDPVAFAGLKFVKGRLGIVDPPQQDTPATPAGG